MRQFSFIDLFAGCGGFSLGLSQAGLQGRFAIERDGMAFDTFRANFLDDPVPETHFNWPTWLERRAWDIKEFIASHLADLKALAGSVDVIAGGPPCQGFSFAGRRLEGDPRNQLFEQYVEIVDAIKPKVLVLENVPGMRVAHRPRPSVKPGPSPAAGKSFYEQLESRLNGVGYSVEARLIDAVRFGVPQRRPRLIVIGLKADLPDAKAELMRIFDLLDDAAVGQLSELGLSAPVSAKDAISDLEIAGRKVQPCRDQASPAGFMEVPYFKPKTEFQKLMHHDFEGRMDSMRLARHRPEIAARFARIISECKQGVRMNDEARRELGLRKHRIFPMAPAAPSPTITTLPDDVLHYSEPRILTVRECARLMSFPDTFRIKGKYTTGGDRRTKECPRYTQVGNAVPPLLARAIGTALRAHLAEAVSDGFESEQAIATPPEHELPTAAEGKGTNLGASRHWQSGDGTRAKNHRFG